MDSDFPTFNLDCLLQVFSFLTESDLINASVVNKFWHDVAETPWLWRQMCLRRWSFCNISQSGTGTLSWKSYYLRRSLLELNMKTGRSQASYVCKSLRGHTGRIVGFGYLVQNNHSADFWNTSPVVCSASADGTVRAWDVQQGVQLWASGAQGTLLSIAIDSEKKIVFTSDTTGVIKSWDGGTGQEMGTFPTASACSTLLPCSTDDQSLLCVGTRSGALYMLTVPTLSHTSRQVICDSFNLDVLMGSPDKKWILTATTESSDFCPKIFLASCLCAPTDDEAPLCQSLPITGCQAAVFLPSEPATRVAMVHSDGIRQHMSVSVFEVFLKKSKYKQEVIVQQVETFPLEAVQWHTRVLLQAKGSSTLVVALDSVLRVYTLKGALLASFEDHTQPIVAVCVDSFRVVTASQDLSLRVLTWKVEQDQGLTLESRYHLLGGSHSMSRGFTGVACDYASIVASVESNEGKDVLKAYSFLA